MLTVLFIVVVVWVVCGVLAYGIVKNYARQTFISFVSEKYTSEMEKEAIQLVVFGSFGLGMALSLKELIRKDTNIEYNIGLTFRMPKELCARRS